MPGLGLDSLGFWLRLWPAGEVMLPERVEHRAQRDVAALHEPAQEHGRQDQEAARGANQCLYLLGLGSSDGASTLLSRELKEAKRAQEDECQAEATPPGHGLDPGGEQLDAGGQTGADHEDDTPTEETRDPVAQEVRDRAAGRQGHGQRDQGGQSEEADPGKLALLAAGDLELWEPRRLHPEALPRRRALRARQALAPSFHRCAIAATSAGTDADILPSAGRNDRCLLAGLFCGYRAQPAGLVVRDRLGDLVAGVHDKRAIPRDRLANGLAAEHEDVQVRAATLLCGAGLHLDHVTRTENRQLAHPDGLALLTDGALPIEHVQNSVEVRTPGKGAPGPRAQGCVQHGHRGMGCPRPRVTRDFAGDYAYQRAAVMRGEEGNVTCADVLVSRRGPLHARGQVHPQLEAVEQSAADHERLRWLLDVEDAGAGRHPLGIAIGDQPAAAI